MLTTQHSDLIWLAKSKTPVSILLVPTKHEGETWYKMMVQPHGAEQAALLLNRSGATRLWKNLNAAIRYVANTLPHVNTVTVQVKTSNS